MSTFVCRVTGTTIEVTTADAAGCDPSGGRWVTICAVHGAVVNSRTRALALSAGRWPDFCWGCQERLG
jgi:hypothetical protein